MSSPNPRFLIDLEIQDLHTVDHASLAQSILRGVELAATPFRIALFGPWGSGKSTIFRMLQTQLQAHELNQGDVFKTVWFNPWEYESSNNLLLSLIDQLANEIPDEIKYSRDGSQILQQARRAADWIGRRWDAHPAHKGSIGGNASDDSDAFTKISAVRETFQQFVDFTLSQGDDLENRRLIIFIDDLDKCRPFHCLNLLEGLKLIFKRQTNIVLLFALDRDVLINAVEHKYGQQQSFETDRYIEKIFEFSFDVPTIAIRHMKPLVRELFTRAGLHDNGLDSLAAVETALSRPGLTLNPRKIKRIFNKFIWFLSSHQTLGLDISSDGDASHPPIDLWLTWLLTGEYWRPFRKLASQHGEPVLAELCNRVTGNPIYPHANQRVRDAFSRLPDQDGLIEYYRGVFNVGRDAHLPQIQERVKAHVRELAHIDRTLKLHGI